MFHSILEMIKLNFSYQDPESLNRIHSRLNNCILSLCGLGGAQVPSGRFQHTGIDLCRRGGAGYRRGGPHCLLRCTEEPHPPGAANGTNWT